MLPLLHGGRFQFVEGPDPQPALQNCFDQGTLADPVLCSHPLFSFICPARFLARSVFDSVHF